ncbi:hypothetical protein EB796_004386 [Bugula neritina]|uniref:Uncharacterized protein n=1 Tax=Bugula neritina TaxID=10212 RepID=A0A7J7KIR7_BUGNE|nr:hypothetical protein EB796_004386 [Bugula neritina]
MSEDKKLMLLTGGNSGIGLEACKILCERGHKIVATVRSDEKGAHCLSEVKSAVPDADIHYMICEMSDVDSVKKLAEEFKSTWLADGQLLDVLINNAGCYFDGNDRHVCSTNEEWEITFATNAIGPILLTDLLIENLKETASEKGEARIVMVNSTVTTMEEIEPYQTDFNDLMLAKPKTYKNGIRAYKNSKVALMMATLGMLDELKDTKVTLNSMCPGPIAGTNLFRSNAGDANKGNLKEPSPQCADREKQKKMIQVIRDMLK